MGSPLESQIAPLAKGLLREILSEPGPQGTGSASRAATLLIVIATIAWVSVSVYHTGTLSMQVIEAALTFMGGGGFVFYGTNKVTTRIQNGKEGAQPRPAAPPLAG